jgi:hypothetical protein
LEARKRELMGERTRLSTENFDELAGALTAQADALAAELADWVVKGGALEARWAAIGKAWVELEGVIGGARMKGRLDPPVFPVNLGAVTDVRAVPRSIEAALAVGEQVAA